MRYRAEWQVLLDDRILEIAAEADGPLDAMDFNDQINAEYNTDHVRRRCNKLVDEGLLKRTHPRHAAYVITDEGRAYLEGAYDVAAGAYRAENNGNTDTGTSEEV